MPKEAATWHDNRGLGNFYCPGKEGAMGIILSKFSGLKDEQNCKNSQLQKTLIQSINLGKYCAANKTGIVNNYKYGQIKIR